MASEVQVKSVPKPVIFPLQLTGRKFSDLYIKCCHSVNLMMTFFGLRWDLNQRLQCPSLVFPYLYLIASCIKECIGLKGAHTCTIWP